MTGNPAVEIVEKCAGLTGDPKVNREIVLLEENRANNVYRAFLPKGELLMMLFKQTRGKYNP